MGEHDVPQELDAEKLRHFTKKLLADLRALELLLEHGFIESELRRVGVEQELFLVDRHWRPAPISIEMLALLKDESFTTELARFNLEFNTEPMLLGGDCLSRMERQIVELYQKARHAAHQLDAEVVMVGILPSLEKSDLSLANMTPNPRYFALNDAMRRLRGSDYEFHIKGADELILRHDSVMVEACNTSFQAHFQVGPDEFVRLYNITQAVAAPVLAAACNSPLLFGKRLWRETRIALFQQSVDHRAATSHLREQLPRVSFGRHWVEESVLEIFREDIARFRVLLAAAIDEDSLAQIRRNKVPQLKALRLHNGTIYRWTRPCYGILDGKPHLRIENRILPAGPTPVDEVANAAFWYGLLAGVTEEYGDITQHMEFDTAQENFLAAARLGLRAQFDWPACGHRPAQELILDHLLPLARAGLKLKEIDGGDIDRYLGVLEERVRRLKSGAQWQLDSLAGLREHGTKAERLAALTGALVARQAGGRPVHEWALAQLEESGGWEKHYGRVEQFMVTELFTVHEDEVVDLVASMMDWKHIRHVPVEDSSHHLVGIVTQRSLLRLIAERFADLSGRPIPVREVMERDVVTTTPEASALEAIELMRRHQVGCLPVVTDGRLVGIITEHDFLAIAGQLLEDELRLGPAERE